MITVSLPLTDGAASVMWGKQYVLINLANTIIANVEFPNNTSITQDTKTESALRQDSSEVMHITRWQPVRQDSL